MKSLILAIFVVFCLSGCALCQERCKITVQEATGQMYDYNLCDINEDLRVSDSPYSFLLNLADSVSSGCAADTAVCMKGIGDVYTSLGRASTRSVRAKSSQASEVGSGLVFSFGSGDKCGETGIFQSTVTVFCNPNERVMTTVTHEDCTYHFAVQTRYGCGTEKESSGSVSYEEPYDSGETAAIVILNILIVGVLMYFGIGLFTAFPTCYVFYAVKELNIFHFCYLYLAVFVGTALLLSVAYHAFAVIGSRRYKERSDVLSRNWDDDAVVEKKINDVLRMGRIFALAVVNVSYVVLAFIGFLPGVFGRFDPTTTLTLSGAGPACIMAFVGYALL